MSFGKTLVLVLLTAASCNPTPGAAPDKSPPPSGGAGAGGAASDPAGAGGAGGAGQAGPSGGPMSPEHKDAASAPSPEPEPGGPGDASADSSADPAVDGAASDTPGPPLPEFPLEAVKAAKAEMYASRGGHVEGVSWRDGEVFFSVIPGGLFRVDQDRKVSRYLDLRSNGTFLLANKSLLVCDDRYGIVQVFPDGKVGVVGSGGRCNDVTVDRWGNIYFSDFQNSITRITPQGQQSKALSGLRQPNGLEVDPESKFLYFMPRPSDIYRVAIDENGPTGQPEKLGNLDGVTDGCAFDAYGNLWVTVYYGGKIGVFDPEKRELLTYVDAGGRGLTNMTFGGPNRDVVFTTVDGKGIMTVTVGVQGFAGHPGAPQYPIKNYLDMQGAP